MQRFATPQSSGGLVTIGISNEDCLSPECLPFDYEEEEGQEFEPVINESERSQVMFSLVDSEGIVEINQDFEDDNADFYIP